MGTETRSKELLLHDYITLLDRSVELIQEYDEIPLKYGDRNLYQAETHTIQQIGRQPGITVSEIAEGMGKTTSACSQIIKKLRKNGAVIQERNPDNNRQYNLHLTEYGWQIFAEHEALDRMCYANYEKHLCGITEEQLAAAIEVQRAMNAAFSEDVVRSREQSGGDAAQEPADA